MGLFSWFLLFLSIILTTSSVYPSSSAHGNSDLIQKTCKNTKYYDLCVSSLKSDASSRKADAKGLALIMIKVGIANATATNSYLSLQMVNVPNDTLMKKVMQECVDMYASANDSLQNSVQDLSMEMYDYAYLHVLAAADYPNSCHNAFNRYPGTSYPSELALREDGLKRICDVVLGIIDGLSL